MNEVPFITGKVEEFIPDDGAAYPAAGVVVDQVSCFLGRKLEKASRFRCVGDVPLVERSMYPVLSTTKLHRHRRSAGESLFGIRAVRDHVDALDCFR